jgi:hypothetical protein
MSRKINIALVAALNAGSASAAFARPAPGVASGPHEVLTDEGQGRTYPAGSGAP